LPAPHHVLPAGWPGPIRGRGPARRVCSWLDTLLAVSVHVLGRARHLHRLLKQEHCTDLVSCSGDLLDIPAGYLAARWARIGFYPYLFDDYAAQWTEPPARLFAARVIAPIVRRSTAVIVPNEFLARAYRDRYGVAATIVRNPVEATSASRFRPRPWPLVPGAIRMIYTGSIYTAHHDAFRNLMAALTAPGLEDVKLHLFTNSRAWHLEQAGIRGPFVLHDQVALAAAAELQQTADLLFLPLAFESPYPEVIQTSAPGKLGEYLASGRPMLVHAPADSFLSWYCRTHDCGAVVDRPSPVELAATLRRLCTDAGWRQRLVANARRRALEDFHIDRVRSTFLELLGRRHGVSASPQRHAA
jgi:glycosyltransferase involved in cell wall biosynthesis